MTATSLFVLALLQHASSFFVPTTLSNRSKPNPLRSTPDQPGSWFRSESSDFDVVGTRKSSIGIGIRSLDRNGGTMEQSIATGSSYYPKIQKHPDTLSAYELWKQGDYRQEERPPLRQPKYQIPNETSPNGQPFEGYLTTGFTSTPDQPGAWFQSDGAARVGAVRPYRTPQVKSVKFGPVRSDLTESSSRQPRIPTQQAKKSVKKPVLPRMDNPSNPDSRTRTTTPSAQQQQQQQQQQVRKPKIRAQWQGERRSSAREPAFPSPSTETVARYSTATPPLPPRERDAPARARATVVAVPDHRIPEPRVSGGIARMEPPTVGGPATYSWETGNPWRGKWHEGTGRGGPSTGITQRGDEVVQGAGSRKTWDTSHHDQTIVEVGSEGRPVVARAQVWQGPGNTPASMTLYSEDGAHRPWKAAFQNTGGSSVLDIRNVGPMEFPLEVAVIGKHDGTKGMGKEEKDFVKQEFEYKPTQYKLTQTVQGQSLKYFNIKAGIPAVMVELFSEGKPMFVQVELWQGPTDTKQSAEIYSDNGNDRHWSAIIETHGRECVVAVRNVGPGLVYPIKASVDPIF